ncbi:hypothetical protein P280DRAFT_240172 [Massarina eburnea CBS 473.64]|uniref:Uncharacterized protein n=1 Tax=Massarina eburnea CBS 473.64 TaxID=1395130 RepID=A0A6A6S905_9PLEO|nr:hypothetical protein P280DRAFT_240172 [Massarina eburnea CBS 473.64]
MGGVACYNAASQLGLCYVCACAYGRSGASGFGTLDSAFLDGGREGSTPSAKFSGMYTLNGLHTGGINEPMPGLMHPMKLSGMCTRCMFAIFISST